jgi:hypothetical protein
MAYFVIYVLAGCLIAYWIHRDAEFRSVDTTAYMVASIFVWPFVIPIWLVTRPPTQLKDLTFEKSYAHYKQWSRSHKGRDLGDLSYFDKQQHNGNGKNEKTESESYVGDINGQTSPDNPYIIGSGKSNSSEFFGENFNDEDYAWDDVNDAANVYEIGASGPRKVYNPFKGQEQKKQGDPGESDGLKYKKVGSKPDETIPSIDDILENTSSMQNSKKKPKDASAGPFVDHNVRKLIDDGRLRDAYRVAKRMLKVASELGEDERLKAYQRYISEIENRLNAENKKSI